MLLLLYRYIALSPEAVGDVLEVAVYRATVEALVGGSRLQGTQMADVWANLDVIEVLLVDDVGHAQTTTVPSDMELRMVLVDVLCQLVNGLGVGITAHKGDTSDVSTVLTDKIVNGICGQGHADVFPEIVTMTTRAVTRAI